MFIFSGAISDTKSIGMLGRMRALVFPPLESGHAMSIALPLHEAAAAMNGRWHGETAARFVGVSTDSRSILAGDLFVALRGVRFDGHAFLAAVQARGAAAAVVDAVGSVAAQALNFPHIVVADTGLALGALAANWRARFQLPVMAVTGSNGKTTSKEMIACIARAALGDQAVLATQGNLNNEIGLPLTLLKLTAEPVPRGVIVERLVPGVAFGVHHIVRYVHVDVVGVLVNPAMALMLGKAKSGGETLFNGLESLRGKLGLVFRAKADKQVVGFFFLAPRV